MLFQGHRAGTTFGREVARAGSPDFVLSPRNWSLLGDKRQGQRVSESPQR